MPYVNVWVDEPDCACECDSRCNSGKLLIEAEDTVDAAKLAIFEGRWKDAEEILHGRKFVEPRVSESRLIQSYKDWKNGKLKGFIPPKAAQ